MKRPACFFLMAGLATSSLSAQTQTPGVKTTTAGVLIDVTVLDREGQPVLDLTPADFELSEDGKVSVKARPGYLAAPLPPQ